MTIEPIPLLLSFAVAGVIVLRILPARQGIAWSLFKVAFAFGVAYVARALLLTQGLDARSSSVLSVIAGLVAYRLVPRRSRHIPRKIRRAVIARDLKGEKFDYRKHHVDHIWPFARGGSHTADNMRVIPKAENLRKGKKKPRLRDWRWF